ncbi:MAG: hypothetical protein BWY72_01707 [Bacteroidetes bacterium ADurb.Bin416]|jgi:hypothetical protein|nr:MAG: hypothetical protein BWY72_01707 [Bacteroidetes bacterium ADurb.Bin416]
MEAQMPENGVTPVTLESKKTVRNNDILFLIVACLITGFLIKLPQVVGFLPQEFQFYQKDAGLILFLGLSTYVFLTNKRLVMKHLFISLAVFAVSAVYINLLPTVKESHSISLAYIHLPLLLWCLYGLIFIDFNTKDLNRRMDYLKYNGDIAILSAIILIAGAMLTAVTLGLFSAIDMNIETFYGDYVVVLGLVSAPIVATYIIKTYPAVTQKIAPIIANLFTPLVVITLVIFLISMVVTGKDPYNDRDFLLVFNLLLLGVMALIVFSVTETTLSKPKRFNVWMLFGLSIITLLVDLVALSAIVYRLGEYGFTPNRTAVLGSNLLIFGHLVLIMIDLFKVTFKGGQFDGVERTIARYLPVYTVWTIVVTFGFPFLFGMK